MRPLVEILIAATIGALLAGGYAAWRLLRDGHEIGMVSGVIGLWFGVIGAFAGGICWGVFRIASGAFK